MPASYRGTRGKYRAKEAPTAGVLWTIRTGATPERVFRLSNIQGAWPQTNLISNLAIGFGVAFTPINLPYCFAGCLLVKNVRNS
jgi:hypothetical protein